MAMDVVLLEVSHWHVSLYLDPLAAAGARVIAVSDRDLARAESVARRSGARVYADWRRLLADERPDFTFAFGRHREMAAMGQALAAAGNPFMMEKPCGLNAAEVRRLRDQANARKLFAAVPLVQRYGPLAEAVGEVASQPGPHHAWFRFIAGPPSRYPAAGSGWMLDAKESGGGCFINLSGHFIDIALQLLPGVTRISARMSNAVYREPVEDYALVTLEAPDGSTAVIETGYLFPSGTGRPREVYYTLLGRSGCRVWGGERAGKGAEGQPWTEAAVNLDIDPLYSKFVALMLTAFHKGQPAPVGMDDMVRVMEVVDAAYTSARTGQPVRAEIPGRGARRP